MITDSRFRIRKRNLIIEMKTMNTKADYNDVIFIMIKKSKAYALRQQIIH
jgi:hypothetical protein